MKLELGGKVRTGHTEVEIACTSLIVKVMTLEKTICLERL